MLCIPILSCIAVTVFDDSPLNNNPLRGYDPILPRISALQDFLIDWIFVDDKFDQITGVWVCRAEQSNR